MGGKYTAQWWEKIADLNREMEARHSPSQIVDDLIQATATGKTSLHAEHERHRQILPALR